MWDNPIGEIVGIVTLALFAAMIRDYMNRRR